ncbi:Rhodanese-like domain-containing protein [Peziza echinospora]|nr:Rhodanese-like domain-containing protein [Peziza echinospora]
MSTGAEQPKPPAWYSLLPPPQSEVKWISREDVYTLLSDPSRHVPGRDFILVDLRRNDHEGGTIKSSLNLPAQSFYQSIPTLYTLALSAGVKSVIFYCGSSTGRGSRAAAWFQDYILTQVQGIDESDGLPKVTSYALEGGVRGWARAGEKFVELMPGYDEKVWVDGGKCAQ